jgi:hypothetical protein
MLLVIFEDLRKCAFGRKNFWRKNLLFVGILKVTEEKNRNRIRNPVVRHGSADPDLCQNVRDLENCPGSQEEVYRSLCGHCNLCKEINCRVVDQDQELVRSKSGINFRMQSRGYGATKNLFIIRQYRLLNGHGSLDCINMTPAKSRWQPSDP